MININSTFDMFEEENDTQNTEDNLIIIKSILSEFIPFYNRFSLTPQSSVELKILTINSLISIVDSCSLTKKSKGKIFSENHSELKFEEKEFLYKAYISSSDTNQTNGKIFHEKTLRLTTLTTQMIRSILILIKEELTYSDASKRILMKKLSAIETVIINEVKSFDYRNLFIFLQYIVLIFCNGIKELFIERIFNNKVDQVETIIKNGVYLEFFAKASSICKITSMNKIECLNENIIFKIIDDHIKKNNINDVNPESIEIHKINILDVLLNKANLKTLVLKRMTIDKIQMIEEIISILQSNKMLKILCIDKFISIPDNYLDGIMKSILLLHKLFKIKLCISSSTIRDMKEFLTLPVTNFKLKRMTLKLNRISLNENDIKEQLIPLKHSNLEKISLIVEQFNLELPNSIIVKNLPQKLTKLRLGSIDHNGLRAINNAMLNSIHRLRLVSLKLYFLPINDEHYDQSYKDIQSIIKHGRIQNIFFYNFILKYKSIADEEIKHILKNNTVLRKLIIRSDIPFHIQHFEGYFYFDLPLYLIEPLLFIYKKHPHFQKFYHKKRILNWIFQYFRIKKDKIITINYQV